MRAQRGQRPRRCRQFQTSANAPYLVRQGSHFGLILCQEGSRRRSAALSTALSGIELVAYAAAATGEAVAGLAAALAVAKYRERARFEYELWLAVRDRYGIAAKLPELSADIDTAAQRFVERCKAAGLDNLAADVNTIGAAFMDRCDDAYDLCFEVRDRLGLNAAAHILEHLRSSLTELYAAPPEPQWPAEVAAKSCHPCRWSCLSTTIASASAAIADM